MTSFRLTASVLALTLATTAARAQTPPPLAPALRAATPPQGRPKAKVALPPAMLDRYAGRYALVGRPEVTLTLRREAEVLMVDPPAGLPSDRLLAESATRFRLASDGSPLEAVLDPTGKILELRFGKGATASAWRPAPK